MSLRADDCLRPPDDSPDPTSTPAAPAASAFSALRDRNFRLFIAGLLVTGTGGWVQRIAQDWLVLDLSHSTTAVGITAACQFLPTLIFGLPGGLIADRYPKRRVLLITQGTMGALAAALALLTLAGQVQIWHVYVLALGLGVATAVDNPTRQSFVSEIVGPDRLRNAISMVSSTFQLGAMIGPAISGLVVGSVGIGYSFALNALTFLGPIVALSLMREQDLHQQYGVMAPAGRLSEGLRYVTAHTTVLWPIVLIGVIGLFTVNLPVTLAAFAKGVFHSGAGGYGLLNSVVAVGSVLGALTSACRRRPVRLRSLAAIATALAGLEVLAGLAPSAWAFVVLLPALGVATMALITSAQSMVQLAAHDVIRGRVMGVYMLVFIGSGAVGGPLVGIIDEQLGARAGLLVAGTVHACVTTLVACRLAQVGRLTVQFRYDGSVARLAHVVARQ